MEKSAFSTDIANREMLNESVMALASTDRGLAKSIARSLVRCVGADRASTVIDLSVSEVRELRRSAAMQGKIQADYADPETQGDDVFDWGAPAPRPLWMKPTAIIALVFIIVTVAFAEPSPFVPPPGHDICTTAAC